MTRPLYRDELENRLDAILSASLSARSTDRLAAGLAPLSREQQELVLNWAQVASQTYDEIAYMVVALAPRALSLLDDAGIEAWVLASLDTYDREGLRPAMEQLRRLDEFCAARNGFPVATFPEVEGRLTRFVHGLSGRPLAIRPGAAPWTDTLAIYLPEVMAVAPDAAGNRAAYKALAANLWAQGRYGTFNVDLDKALRRWPDRERALQWLVRLEAVRLSACIAAELPGLATEMAAVRGQWPPALAAALPRLQPPATVLTTLQLLERRMDNGEVPPELPLAGVLDPAAAARVRSERIARDTQVLRRALARLQGAAGKRDALPQAEVRGDLNTGLVELSVDGEAIALPPEAGAAALSLIQDLGAVPPEALQPAGPGEWSPAQSLAAPELISDSAADWQYDEWDYHRHAYRRGWCHVYEMEGRPGESDYVERVHARYAPLIRQIRRRFEALRGEDRMVGRQPDGEEVDIDALVEAASDRRSGAEPSTRLFCRRVRNQRSLAALFMVDMSGSTRGWVNDAEREALVMLCHALETLGDAFAIYGFSGWTRTRCDIYRIKGFNERYDAAVRARIAGIEAKDYTRLGVAIRHLTGVLEGQPARHRLLITLSDGRPDDFGDEYRGRYGIEDTRRALLETMRRGIRPFCITLDREARDYLPQLYGTARYTVIDDVSHLPYKVADIYRRLTH